MQRIDGSNCRNERNRSSVARTARRFFSITSAISCATRRPRAPRSRAQASRRRRSRCRSRPTAGRPAPATSAPCSRAAMSRCCSRPPTRRSAASSRRRSRATPGVQLAAFAVADAAACASAARRGGLPHAAAGVVLSARSGPRPAPPPRPSRWRASSPARWRRAASRCSPITPRTRCGSRAGSTHPNGALGLASLVIAVADVDEAAARFARFTGRPATRDARQDNACSSTAAGSIS